MRKVYILGAINIDISIAVPQLPSKNSVLYSTDFSYDLSGKATNLAIGLSNLGLKPILLGALGDDMFGKFALLQLWLRRLKTRYLGRAKDIPTGNSLVMVDKHKHRSVIVTEGANGHIGEDLLTRVSKNISQDDVLYLTTETSSESIHFIVEKIRKKVSLIIADIGPHPTKIKSILRDISIIIMNKSEAEILSARKINNRSALEKAGRKIRNLGGRDIVITLGNKGVFLFPLGSKKGMIFDPIHVNVTDSSGAGDAFRAAFIYKYLSSRNIVESLDCANFAGAYAVTKMGMLSSLPSKRELEMFITDLRRPRARSLRMNQD